MGDRTRSLITAVILLTAVFVSAAPTAAQPTAYAPTYLNPLDLGTLGGDETRAYDANGSRIVGASQTADGTVHAFKYEAGAMTDLGTLGGSTSWAFAINAAGAVVGSANVPRGPRLCVDSRQRDAGSGDAARDLKPGIGHQRRGPGLGAGLRSLVTRRTTRSSGTRPRA
jgi:probable HAF family extracellular repeat protein